MNRYSLRSIFLLILSFSFLFAYSGSKKSDIGFSKLELDQAERELVNSQDSASAEMPAESTSSTTTPTLLPNIDLSNWKVRAVLSCKQSSPLQGHSWSVR